MQGRRVHRVGRRRNAIGLRSNAGGGGATAPVAQNAMQHPVLRRPQHPASRGAQAHPKPQYILKPRGTTASARHCALHAAAGAASSAKSSGATKTARYTARDQTNPCAAGDAPATSGSPTPSEATRPSSERSYGKRDRPETHTKPSSCLLSANARISMEHRETGTTQRVSPQMRPRHFFPKAQPLYHNSRKTLRFSCSDSVKSPRHRLRSSARTHKLTRSAAVCYDTRPGEVRPEAEWGLDVACAAAKRW